MTAVRMAHMVEPKKEIMTRVKGLVGCYQCIGADVLCAIYIRPEQTKGGLFLPGNQGIKKEDEFQGKVGLVLAMGPLAFTEDADHKWGGVIPKIGDWVVWRVGDTLPLSLGDQKCRVVDEGCIRGIVTDPDIVM